MRKHNFIYFVLILLLVTGGFASMAQNDYGMTLIGIVAFVFALIFMLRFTSSFDLKHLSLQHFEWLCLFVLAAILGMRVFYLWFPGVELLFTVSATLLAIIYIQKLLRSFSALRLKSKPLSKLIIPFFVGIILYILSLTLTPVFPFLGPPLGGVAFAFTCLFLVWSAYQGPVAYDERRVSVFNFLGKQKDGSILLLTIFLIFTAYMGLTMTSLVPGLYEDRYPPKYYELVNRVESGELDQNEHEVFKDDYERFMKRNATAKNRYE